VTTLVVSFQPDFGTTEVVTTIFSHLLFPLRLGMKFWDSIEGGPAYLTHFNFQRAPEEVVSYAVPETGKPAAFFGGIVFDLMFEALNEIIPKIGKPRRVLQ